MGEEMTLAFITVVAVGLGGLVVADLILYHLSTRVFYKVMTKVVEESAAIERSIAGFHEFSDAQINDLKAIIDDLRAMDDRLAKAEAIVTALDK